MLAYLDSLGMELPDGLDWAEVRAAAARRIAARVAERGVFRVTGRFGLFACR